MLVKTIDKLEQCKNNNKSRYFIANLVSEVRTVICELSQGKRCSHKRHRWVFSGQTGNGLRDHHLSIVRLPSALGGIVSKLREPWFTHASWQCHPCGLRDCCRTMLWLEIMGIQQTALSVLKRQSGDLLPRFQQAAISWPWGETSWGWSQHTEEDRAKEQSRGTAEPCSNWAWSSPYFWTFWVHQDPTPTCSR